METKALELSGLIRKEEMVCNVTSFGLQNTTILESCLPMPGYYGKNEPDAGKPRSIFILLDIEYEPLLIARKLKLISSQRKHNCYGSFGKISLRFNSYACVRIKNLDCFASIHEIQQALIENGLKLLRFIKIDEMAQIEIHKVFMVNNLTEGIYTDVNEPDRSYISIPSELTWERFLYLTRYVKNNLSNNLFDAAMGVFWRFGGPEDVIRIYDKKHSPERISEIRQSYLNAMKMY